MTNTRKADASDELNELRARVEALEAQQRLGWRPLNTETVYGSKPAVDTVQLHTCSIETLEQRLTPPMAEVAADPAPAIEPPPLDVPQALARDWINRHGTFRPTPAGAERTGTDWGMVITEAARWGQRRGWDARPEQPAPAADVAPLLWVLWHHMGGNSPVGQPIREYLGMGQFERMSKEQVEAAKGWGSIPFQIAMARLKSALLTCCGRRPAMTDHTLHHYRATLERIVDGDTIDVLLDLGFKIHARQRLRLLGIDTPERGQPGFMEATHDLAALIDPDGPRLPLIVHTIKRDSFGRWLATVWVEGSDTSINDQMIQRGHQQ